MNKKKVKKFILEILGTIIGVLAFIALVAGISFAWFSWQSSNNTLVSFTVGGVDITFDAGADITSSKLRPVSTKEVGVSKGYAVKKTITASSPLTAYLNLYLTLETLPNGLKHESFIWELYKGSSRVYSGSTVPAQSYYNTIGQYSLRLTVKNNRGLTSETYSRKFEIIEDNIPPSVTIEPLECDWTQSVDVKLEFYDDGGSGFKHYKYAITDSLDTPSSWSSNIASVNGTITINTDGIKYLHIIAEDNATPNKINSQHFFTIFNVSSSACFSLPPSVLGSWA